MKHHIYFSVIHIKLMPGNNITPLTSFLINYLHVRFEAFMTHEFTKMFSCCQLCPNWVEIQDLRDLNCIHYQGCGKEEMFADRSTGSFSLQWYWWWETDQVYTRFWLTYNAADSQRTFSWILPYLVLPCATFHYEKLTTVKLVSKFPASHGTQRFISVLTTRSYSEPDETGRHLRTLFL